MDKRTLCRALLLGELGDTLIYGNVHDTKAMHFFEAQMHRGDGDVGVPCLMEAEQIAVVLLVDVVSRKNK
jgi:hypothetical protein